MGRLESLQILLTTLGAELDAIKDSSSFAFRVVIGLNSRDSLAADAISTEIKKYLLLFPSGSVVVETEQFLDSADESTLWAFSNSSADYVWMLGDDDIIFPGALNSVLSAILSNLDVNYFYLNSRWISPQGGAFAGAALATDTENSRLKFRDFILRTGFNYPAGGLTRIVVRRISLDVNFWKEAIQHVDPVWSTVSAFCKSYWNDDVVLVNEALVGYRLSDYHIGMPNNWANYARVKNVKQHALWTTILIGHLQYLKSKDVLRFQDFYGALVSDHAINKTFDSEISEHILSQLKMGLDDKRERFIPEEIELICNFLALAMPFRLIEIERLKTLAKDPNDPQKLERCILAFENSRSLGTSSSIYDSLYVGQIGSYLIFKHSSGYIGIHTVLSIEEGFKPLIPESEWPFLIWSESLKTIEGLVAECASVINSLSQTNKDQLLNKLKALNSRHGSRKDLWVSPEMRRLSLKPKWYKQILLTVKKMTPVRVKILLKETLDIN